jgi:hypothetical protein
MHVEVPFFSFHTTIFGFGWIVSSEIGPAVGSRASWSCVGSVPCCGTAELFVF